MTIAEQVGLGATVDEASPAQLRSFGRERLFGFPSNCVKPGTCGRGDDGGKDAFDEGCRHQSGSVDAALARAQEQVRRSAALSRDP